MNINPKYTRMWDRKDLISHLEKNNYSRVLDIGGSRTQIPFGDKYISHIFDLVKSEQEETREKTYFIGSCCYTDSWIPVFEDVKNNGKFDFVICTHTLEDLALPGLVVKFMPAIAKRGYIATPSKYAECMYREGNYSGYGHHRWIFDIKKDNKILVIPKSPLMQHAKKLDNLYGVTLEEHLEREELQFFWEDYPEIYLVENIDAGIIELYNSLAEKL